MSTTVAALSIGTLGVPAMLVAGLASSAHCAVMCGALAAGRRSIDVDRAAGRLLAYAAIGALAGGAGGWLLQVGAWAEVGRGIRLLLLPLVVWLLVRTVRASSRVRPCCEPGARRVPEGGHARRVSLGFASALLPCPLLLAAAGYAMLSGSAMTGAALLLAFGIGTTPAVQAGAWMWSRAAALPVRAPVMVAGASAVALLGAVGAPALIGWCVGG